MHSPAPVSISTSVSSSWKQKWTELYVNIKLERLSPWNQFLCTLSSAGAGNWECRLLQGRREKKSMKVHIKGEERVNYLSKWRKTTGTDAQTKVRGYRMPLETDEGRKKGETSLNQLNLDRWRSHKVIKNNWSHFKHWSTLKTWGN